MNERDYIKGKRCLVDLYNSKNIKEYEVFDKEGYEEIENVRNLVLKRFKNLDIIDRKLDTDRRIDITERLLNKGYSIGNGALKYKDLKTSIDVIENTAYGINVYVIDISTNVSEKSKRKGEFIQYICKKLHIEIEKMMVIYINTKYTREKELNLNLLFKCESINRSDSKQVEKGINEIREVIDKNRCMKKSLEEECISNKCKGIQICFPEVKEADIFKIDGNSLRIKKKVEYFKSGIKTFKDVSEKIKPKNKFKIMLDSEIENKEYLDKKEIEKYLSKIEKFPLYFLDFETFQEVVPSYEGRRSYMQIPFQYSLHILYEDGYLVHKEYLGNENEDTTRGFSESLIKDIKEDSGNIVVYNASFEKGIIKHMAEMYKDLRPCLEGLNKRIVDLMIPFKEKYIYRKEMAFSASIKKVLPSLCGKEFSYEGLNIKDGIMAMKTFPSLKSKTKEEREKTRTDLLEYCKLDTLAMVKVYEELKERIRD